MPELSSLTPSIKRRRTEPRKKISVTDATIAPTVRTNTNQNYFCNHCNGTAEACSSEMLTADYVRVYGKDYWDRLHEIECPAVPARPDENDMEAASDYESDDNIEEEESEGSDSQSSGRSQRSSTSSNMNSTPTRRMYAENKKLWKRVSAANTTFCYQKYPTKESQRPLTEIDQTELTPKMRAILVDWLIELSDHFNFGPATLHLAITMVDRVLACGLLSGKRKLNEIGSDDNDNDNDDDDDDDDDDSHLMSEDQEDHDDANKENEPWLDDDEDASQSSRCYNIPRDRFQLLGVTCTWLACKVLEMNPPKAKDIAYVSDNIYCVEQIKTMERRVCNALNFSFFREPTPYQFLLEFLRASNEGDTPKVNNTNQCQHPFCGIAPATKSVVADMANYLLELGRLPYAPVTRKPSLLAAAAVYLARKTLGICSQHCTSTDPEGIWTPTLQFYTGYSKADLKETVEDIHAYHISAEGSSLKSTFAKYKSRKHQRVAFRTVLRKEDLGY
jgi:hypothetical protein